MKALRIIYRGSLSYQAILKLLIGCILLSQAGCRKEVQFDPNSDNTLRYIEGGPKDRIYTVEPTSDGGFIYCGKTEGSASEGFLLKVNSQGIKEWYKNYGGKNNDVFRHAIQTSDGGYVAVGSTNSFGNGALDSITDYNDYMVKTDAQGNIIWHKCNFLQMSQLDYVSEGTDQHFYATGFRVITASNLAIVKIDPNGNLIYGGHYTGLNQIPPNLVKPNYYRVFGSFVKMMPDGNILIAGGMSKSTLALEARLYLNFWMKANPVNGAPIEMYPYYDFVRSRYYTDHMNETSNVRVLPLTDGYLFATDFEDNTNNIKIQLLRTDFSGNLIWEKRYSGLGQSIFRDIITTTDGNFICVGASSAISMNNSYPRCFENLKMMAMKINSDGEILWSKYLGSDQNVHCAYSIQEKKGGGYTLAGASTMNETGFDRLLWIQLDKNGEIMKPE